jgi:hypothetical protein
MANELNKQALRRGAMALALTAFALPNLAVAQPEGGTRGEWQARSEDGGRHARADNQDDGAHADRQASREQARAADAPPPAPTRQAAAPQQAGWSHGGGNGWAGGHRDRSADQNDQRRARTDSNDARAPAAPAPPQQSTRPAWAGHQGQAWNHDTRREGGNRNWTDADRRDHEGGDRHQHDDRHRDQTGGYVRGGYYYGNNSGYNRNDDDHDRDDHEWNRQWRNNSSYNWYSYRSSHPSYYRLGTYYSPYRNYSYRRLSIGFFLDQLFFGRNYQIEDPRYYRLPEVYGPYRWVRYYDDAVLVDIYSGEVVDVINNFFW